MNGPAGPAGRSPWAPPLLNWLCLCYRVNPPTTAVCPTCGWSRDATPEDHAHVRDPAYVFSWQRKAQ